MTIVSNNGHQMKELTLPAGEFKARCLKLMDQVRERGEEIVITKHGRPVAKLVPVAATLPEVFAYLKGTVTYHGDIVEPPGEVWDADV